MQDLLFYIFGSLALASALMVPLSRNAVNSAIFLIVTLVSTASLFVLLEAFFLGVIQILVYAGAVVVLFLFVVMLLSPDQPKRRYTPLTFLASIGALILLAFGIFFFFGPGLHLPAIEVHAGSAASLTRNYGYPLFTKYMLPFQTAGILLLAAMIGIIALSRKAAQDISEGAGVPQKGDSISADSSPSQPSADESGETVPVADADNVTGDSADDGDKSVESANTGNGASQDKDGGKQ